MTADDDLRRALADHADIRLPDGRLVIEWERAYYVVTAALAARSEPRDRSADPYWRGYSEGLNAALAQMPVRSEPRAEGLREDPAEVLRRASIYVLQLADRDIHPLLGESLLRAIGQDGYTVAAIPPAEGLRATLTQAVAESRERGYKSVVVAREDLETLLAATPPAEGLDEEHCCGDVSHMSPEYRAAIGLPLAPEQPE